MPQLYSRVFLQILDSSLANDWQARFVFEDFLKLANEDGVVDMTHEAVARRTNVPMETVRHGIGILESPDPGSRNADEGGRRIVRLDDHREWGWRIVNWSRYDSIRSNLELREAKAREMARYRAKVKSAPLPAPLSSESSDSDSDTEAPLHVDHTSATCSLHVAYNAPVASAKTPKLPAAKLPADDAEWIQSLKSNPAFQGIDVPVQVAKCQLWCSTNGKSFSRRRVVNWLNRVEKPLNGAAKALRVLPNGQTTTVKTAGQQTLDEISRRLDEMDARPARA